MVDVCKSAASTVDPLVFRVFKVVVNWDVAVEEAIRFYLEQFDAFQVAEGSGKPLGPTPRKSTGKRQQREGNDEVEGELLAHAVTMLRRVDGVSCVLVSLGPNICSTAET